MPRAYLVYNPVAGRYPSWLLVERALKLFAYYGWDIHLEPSRSGEHVTRLAFQAVDEGMDALFVVGGDGTINNALTGLLNSETAFRNPPRRYSKRVGTGAGSCIIKLDTLECAPI